MENDLDKVYKIIQFKITKKKKKKSDFKSIVMDGLNRY